MTTNEIEKVQERLIADQFALINALKQELKEKKKYCKWLLKEGFDLQNENCSLRIENEKLKERAIDLKSVNKEKCI